MDTLDGLKTVIAVVETSSFTAASERLGMSKALVSKYVVYFVSHLVIVYLFHLNVMLDTKCATLSTLHFPRAS